MARQAKPASEQIDSRPVIVRERKRELGLLLADTILCAHGGRIAFRIELTRDPEAERKEESWRASEL